MDDLRFDFTNDDPDLRCVHCGHTREQHHSGPGGVGGCAYCECFLFVSVSAWEAEGRRAEVPQP